MAPLTYRIRDIQTKQLVSPDCLGYFFVNSDGQLYSNQRSSVYEFVGDEYTIERCTNILDKNNKLIYEGDKVKSDEEHVLHKVFGAHNDTASERSYAPLCNNAIIEYWHDGFHLVGGGIGNEPFRKYMACDCCPCALEII